ncbi:MAG: maleylpyruvate isomerase family mycothiol-dependent enzyme [Propionibacteriaceae bacterium]|jgi:maleylpyruvate isomerase|nr:maleylpyruvate isomerase family mycothiol-dependent enzyme [Propionibacteriaceae bacterium]
MPKPWSQLQAGKLRYWHNVAGSRLLGDTISLTDAEWHAPSVLPGWSRAHVATHLARDAETFIGVLEDPQAPFNPPSDLEKIKQLEVGADRSGIEVQEDLDRQIANLSVASNAVPDWNAQFTPVDESYPLLFISLVRLHEVLIHHLDLGIGFSPDRISPEPASWLLDFVLLKMSDATNPAVEVVSTEGLSTIVGVGAPDRRVHSSDARLWAWLSGRIGPDWVEGAEGLQFELLA